MKPEDRLKQIVDEGLCVGCGLCQSLLTPGKIRMTISHMEELRPVVVGELAEEDGDLLEAVCPGIRVDGLNGEEMADGSHHIDDVWGPYLRIVRAWAGNSIHRFEGSTGGVLTALASWLLKQHKVSFILHVKASTTNPTFGERHLSFTEKDVLAAAGSRYGPVAPLIDLKDVLNRREEFAVIGKPCDITALRNLARIDPEIDRYVKYQLAFVCGGPTPSIDIRQMITHAGVDPEQLESMRYRGRGCPGPTTMTMKLGRVVHKRYSDFLNSDGKTWPMPFRCKLCPDGIGESADIAVSDTWLGGGRDPSMEDSDPGTNAIIIRTRKGRQLVEEAAEDGALFLERDVHPREMDLYQPHQRDKKFAVWARHEGLRREGRLVPVTSNLRLKLLADQLGPEFNNKQIKGARQRAQQLVRNHVPGDG